MRMTAPQPSELRTSPERHTRRQQVGIGMRGNKRRRIALQRDAVIDHITGRRARVPRCAGGWGRVITESALEGQEVAIALRAREQWPKWMRFLRLYR